MRLHELGYMAALVQMFAATSEYSIRAVLSTSLPSFLPSLQLTLWSIILPFSFL